MNTPMIPRQIVVVRSKNYGHTYRRASSVPRYDEAMREVFPFFVPVPTEVARQLTDALGAGYSSGGYGPFYPSFSSMNGSESDLKVVWFSQAGLECLEHNLSGRYLFTVEPKADTVE